MESVLHKRYKIGERLFSNALGELFLGRDLQASGNQRLLIHYLPAQLLSDYALKQSLRHLQSLGSKAEVSVLKVLDCAWSDTEVCFVLEAPEAWSLSVLPALQGQPTNLHQKALSITQQLIDQGLITKGIDPALFLVAPNGDLHLMGTAFLTELQALEQQSSSLLQPQPEEPPKKKTRFLTLALLGGMGLVVAAGSLGIHQFAVPSRVIQVPTPPAVTVSTLDKPSTPITHTTSLVTAVEPKPATLEDSKPNTVNITRPPVTSPVLATQTTNKPSSPINPQALKHLERAQEAIQRGHLQTGLYYLRLAKKLAANPTQLQTVARQLLEQTQLTGTASEAISPQMQADIQQEFELE